MLKALPQWHFIMISEQALKEFKTIWLEEFGEKITDKKALEEAVALLTMFDAIYRPLRREWVEKQEENQNVK